MFSARFDFADASLVSGQTDQWNFIGTVQDFAGGIYSAGDAEVGDIIYANGVALALPPLRYKIITIDPATAGNTLRGVMQWDDSDPLSAPIDPIIGEQALIGYTDVMGSMVIPSAAAQLLDYPFVDQVRAIEDQRRSAKIIELEAAKGAAIPGGGGLATLDQTGKILPTQIPDQAITETFVVADEAAMKSSGASKGDIAVRPDGTFILKGANPAVLTNWVALGSGGGGGGTGGHELEITRDGSTFTAMPQRAKIVFTGTGIDLIDSDADDATYVQVQGGTDIIKPGTAYMGDWITARPYQLGQLVLYNGSCYMALQDHTSVVGGANEPEVGKVTTVDIHGEPHTTITWPDYWALIARKGSPGIAVQQQWKSAVGYKKDDLVSNTGQGWLALRDVAPGIAPSAANPLDWQLYIQKGGKGDKGDQGVIGPIGPPGVSLAAWTAPWSSSISYPANVVVQYNGSAWRTLRQVTVGVVPIEGPDWTLFVSKGAKGDQGFQGEQGLKGDTGDIGPAGFGNLRIMGLWRSTTSYSDNDVVTYQGEMYGLLAGKGPCVNVQPDSNPTYWQKMVERQLTWKGIWSDAGVAYVPGDGVKNTVDGSSYICLQAHTSSGSTIPTDGAQWMMLAEKGEVGERPAANVAAVITGAVGTSAEVAVVNTETGFDLTFTIPRGDKGETGNPGTNGTNGYTPQKNINYFDGKNAINYRNSFVAGTAYRSSYPREDYRGPDAVLYNGAIYLCISDYSGVKTPDDPTVAANWALISPKGDRGPGGAGNLIAHGAWTSFIAYVKNEVVSHNGSAWLCVGASGAPVGSEPIDGSPVWEKWVSKGDPGPPGPSGSVIGNATIYPIYSSLTLYRSNAIVSYQGQAWIAVQNNITAEEPGVSPAWQLWVSKGDQGLKGDKGDKGDTGDQGPAGYGVGNITLLPTYDNVRAYTTSDAVSHNGKLWLCIQAVTGVEPTIGDPNWTVIVEKGDQGLQGDQGVQGPSGYGVGDLIIFTNYDPAMTYTTVNIVSYNGKLWVPNNTITGSAPVEGNPNWTKVVDKGEKGDQGDQGIQGIQGEVGLQGPPSVGNAAVYSQYEPARVYALNDIVPLNGSTWMCVQAGTTGVTPAEGSPNWVHWVSKGDKGDQGLQGNPGVIGLTGLRGEKGDPGINLIFQGPWDPTRAYSSGMLVEDYGSVWECVSPVLANSMIRPTDMPTPPQWRLFMSKGDTGDQGARGMTFSGNWDAGTTYAQDVVVVQAGSAYISLAGGNQGNTPAASPLKWTLISQKGDKGATLVYSGIWVSGAPYVVDDLVKSIVDKNIYVCISDIASTVDPSADAVTATPSWMIFLEKGLDGKPYTVGNYAGAWNDYTLPADPASNAAGVEDPAGNGIYNTGDLVTRNGNMYLALKGSEWNAGYRTGLGAWIAINQWQGNVGRDPETDTEFWVKVSLQGDPGPKGDPGVGLRVADLWNGADTYQMYDLVYYDGQGWSSQIDGNRGFIPGGDPTKWVLAIKKGLDGIGIDGAPGRDGVDGTNGVDGLNFVPKGSWAPGTAYYGFSDAVYFQDTDGRRSIYRCISTHTSTTANPEDTLGSLWEKWVTGAVDGKNGVNGVSIKGDKGDQGNPGVQGIPGLDGAQGPPGMIWRGPWDVDTNYGQWDAVNCPDGNTYICLLASLGVNPVGDTTDTWQLFASKGDQGATGASGAALAFKRDWLVTTSYAKDDLVKYQGSTWASLTDGNVGNTPEESPWWTEFVAKGINGINLLYRSSWLVGTSYQINDLVSFGGSSYVCLVANSGVQPDSDPLKWEMFVAKGAAGLDGQDGADGNIGPEGPPGATLVYLGLYNSGATYDIHQLVTYGGSSWVSKVANNTGNTPVDGSAYWDVFVSGSAGGSGGWVRLDASAPSGGTGPGNRTYSNVPTDWQIGPANVAPFNTLGLGTNANDLVIYHNQGRYVADVTVYDFVASGPSAGISKLEGSLAYSGLKSNVAMTAIRLQGFATTSNPVKIMVALAD